MINFVVTLDHRYPMERMLGGEYGVLPFEWRQVNYGNLFEAGEIDSGTWIFQDIERLVEWERLRAARIATELEKSGARVLNHPVRACGRYELQRRLFTQGINRFQTFRGDEMRMPTSWPVFIRFEHDHKSPNPTLFYNPEQLNAALAAMVSQSIPLGALLIVEYCGEQGADGLWRKYAAYRVGDEIIHHHLVREDSWVAKNGNPDLQFDEDAWRALRTEERDYVESEGDPHQLMRSFHIGSLEFGRMDYNLVGGEPQIYEINTNPVIGEARPEGDKVPDVPRDKLHRRANHKIIEALRRLDSAPGARVRIGDINTMPKRP